MSYASLLEQVDIFHELNDAHLERISDICVEHRYEQGDLIFEENAKSDGLYVILNGDIAIEAHARNNGETPAATRIARLRRGQSFGEVALVDEGVRSAAARATAPDTRLLLIRRVDLIEICREDCELGFFLMRNLAVDLALKIRQTDLYMRQSE